MRLMEIVPCKETDPVLMKALADFISSRLGKGIVYAKDTTNFIANRIGTYAIYKGIQHMVEMGMTRGRGRCHCRSGHRPAKECGLQDCGSGRPRYPGPCRHQLLRSLPDDEEREVFKTAGLS